jgi:hypothetical protein
VRFLSRWLEVVPARDPGFSAHWGLLLRGQVVLRDDSLMNLSPETHVEFVKPFDERILERFGGGMIHFCGKADHCIERMTDSANLRGVDVSQPHLNDLDRCLAATVRRGINLYVGGNPELLQQRDFPSGVVLRT